MYIKQCDRCKIIIKGEYADLTVTIWAKNGSLVKDMNLHLCSKCMKWFETEKENGSLGNS